MKKDLRNGFTLIELVIIMVILGVLAAVAIPRIGNTIDSSEVSAEEAVIGSLRSALEVYAMDQVVLNSTRSYPQNPFDHMEKAPKSYTGIGVPDFDNFQDSPETVKSSKGGRTVFLDCGAGKGGNLFGAVVNKDTSEEVTFIDFGKE